MLTLTMLSAVITDSWVLLICISCLSFKISGISTGEIGGSLVGFDESRTRTKRILWGEPLLEPTSYGVMRYIVYITNGNTCPDTWNQGSPKSENCEPFDERYQHCGGALITEYIVQTACHCVGFGMRVNETHIRVLQRNPFEDKFTVYVGYYDSHKMSNGKKPLLYLIHQKCSYFLAHDPYREMMSYDFGIIFTAKALVKLAHVSFAPIYAIRELLKMYSVNQREERVCLYVGWGGFTTAQKKVNGKVGYKTYYLSSRYLQHGWSRATSYHSCRYSAYRKSHLEELAKVYYVKYKEIATWFCTKHFGRMMGFAARGDSGSPVTCDDSLVGLVSQGSELIDNATQLVKGKFLWQYFTQYTASNMFSLYENAAEYRAHFLDRIAMFAIAKAKLQIPGMSSRELADSSGSHSSLCHVFNSLGLFISIIVNFISPTIINNNMKI